MRISEKARRGGKRGQRRKISGMERREKRIRERERKRDRENRDENSGRRRQVSGAVTGRGGELI